MSWGRGKHPVSVHPVSFYSVCLFLALLGLHCCTWAFSSCGEQGLLYSWGVQAPHCAGFSSCKAQVPGHVGFSSCSSPALELSPSSCGTRAQFPLDMWIFPGQGLNPCPTHQQTDSQPQDHQGSLITPCFLKHCFPLLISHLLVWSPLLSHISVSVSFP